MNGKCRNLKLSKKNETQQILCDFDMHTINPILTRKPDLVLISANWHQVDFIVQTDHIFKKKNEEIHKYPHHAKELKKQCSRMGMVLLMSMEGSRKSWKKRVRGAGIQGKNRNHPDFLEHSTVEEILNSLKKGRRRKEICCITDFRLAQRSR